MQQYFFTPVMTALVRRFGTRKNTPYLGACGYFATFFIIGLWHGVGVRYALFGLALGIFASANKLWDVWLPRMTGKKLASEIKAGRFYRAALGGVSVFLIATSLSLVWVDRSLLSQVGVNFILLTLPVGLVSGIGLSLGGSAAAAIGDAFRFNGTEAGAKGVCKVAAGQIWLAVKCFIAIGILLMQGEQMPAFIYEGF